MKSLCGFERMSDLARGVGISSECVLTDLCEDHRSDHTPPLTAVAQEGGVARRRKEFAVAEGQQV